MLVLAHASSAFAQKPSIFSCTVNGRTITSDRPIPECSNRDQRQLNPDGSTNRVVPPTPTQEERAEMEQRQREADAERAARNEAIRRDRNLVIRFPNEARHRAAREKALEDIRISVRNSEARVAQLASERKPLLEELEFFKPPNRPPLKLKLALDGNEASMEGQKSLIANQQSEVGRINANYDAELGRLRKLWAGAPLGSVPAASTVLPVATAVPTAAAAAPKNPTR